MSDSSCMLEGMFQSRRFSISSVLGSQNWLAVDSSKAKIIFKALVALSVKWSVLKIVTYDRVSFSFGSFVIYCMCQYSLCNIFSEWDKFRSIHGSHMLGFSQFIQIGWHIHISTLNDHKKSQSQLGGIRSLPSVSHKRHQLRVTACFTNMRCIVVIKEALQ